MLGNDYENQACSIAGALEVVGERWSLLIVRDVFLGLRRFDEIQADLGIARNVLQTRLTRLLEQGVLEKRLYRSTRRATNTASPRRALTCGRRSSR